MSLQDPRPIRANITCGADLAAFLIQMVFLHSRIPVAVGPLGDSNCYLAYNDTNDRDILALVKEAESEWEQVKGMISSLATEIVPIAEQAADEAVARQNRLDAFREN